MNILLLTNSYLPKVGGLEIAVHNIAREMARAGHKVTVVTGGQLIRHSREMDSAGIEVHRMSFVLPRIITRLGARRMGISLLTSMVALFTAPLTVLALARLITSVKPDIVNLHYIAENAAFCLFARTVLGFPLVVNAHGGDIEGYSERSFISKALTKKVLRVADLILVNSSGMLESIRAVGEIVERKLKVISNGISLQDFESIQPFKHRARYILSVGNFSHNKGKDVLIHAFRYVKASHVDVDLILAGDGPEIKKCQVLAEQLGLSDSAIFLGNVQRPAVLSLMAGCTAFVLPSRREAFGIVVLEAMASKKPVIATRTNGPLDMITHLETGILVDKESPEAIADGIQLLLRDPDLANAIGARGYERVAGGFTWDSVVRAYAKEYETLLTDPRTRRGNARR